MSYLLPHLHHAYAVDQAILSEEGRVVVVRFGRDHDPACMRMDELLAGVADKVKAFACIYLVDIDEVRARALRRPTPAPPPFACARMRKKRRAPETGTPRVGPARSTSHALPPPPPPKKDPPSQVPDFNAMYELYDPCTVMFFFRNKHIMVDLGTGNNNKINWAMEEKQEFVDIVEVVYRGARKGRGLVVSPKDYSTRYRY
jgi:DIM1 family U5 snRNP protein